MVHEGLTKMRMEKKADVADLHVTKAGWGTVRTGVVHNLIVGQRGSMHFPWHDHEAGPAWS